MDANTRLIDNSSPRCENNNIGIGQGAQICPRNRDVIPGDANRADGTARPAYGRMKEIDLTIEVSHFQTGVREDYRHTKHIQSSSEFVQKHRESAGSMSASSKNLNSVMAVSLKASYTFDRNVFCCFTYT